MGKIHIALVGDDKNNIVNGVGLIGGNELYPIISEKYADKGFEELDDLLSFCNVHRTIDDTKLVIDPFGDDAYQELVELILKISDSIEPQDDLYINITGGTNLMSAAGMSGALLARATAYYVLERERDVILLPWHSYDISKLKEKDRDVIQHLFEHDGASDSQICNALRDKMKDKPKKNYTLRKIRYSLKKLQEEGYIKQIPDGRKNRNELTIWGKIAEKLM